MPIQPAPSKVKAKTKKQPSRKAPSKPATGRSATPRGKTPTRGRSGSLRNARAVKRAARQPAEPHVRCERCLVLTPPRTMVQLYDDYVCPGCSVVWYALAVVPGEESRVVARVRRAVAAHKLRSVVKAVKIHRHEVRVARLPSWLVVSTRGDGTEETRTIGADDFEHIQAKYRKFWPGEKIQDYTKVKEAREVAASVKATPGYVLVKMAFGPAAARAVEVEGAIGLLPVRPTLGRTRYPKGEPPQRVKPTKKELEEAAGWRPVPLGWDEDLQVFLDKLKALTEEANRVPAPQEEPVTQEVPMPEMKVQEQFEPGDKVRVTAGLYKGVVTEVCRATPAAVEVRVPFFLGGQRHETTVSLPHALCERAAGG